MARLHRNGLQGLLDDHGSDITEPLPREVVDIWHQHLHRIGPTHLALFMMEPDHSIENLGLTAERACAVATMRRLVHPARMPWMPDWPPRLAVQICLLQERLCPLEPGLLATWLQSVCETWLRPTADAPSVADLDLLLRLLVTITRHETFTAHSWLSQQTDALALRHAVTDLLRSLPDIVGRCSDLTPQTRHRLEQTAAGIRL